MSTYKISCVELKNQIQAQLLEKYSEKTEGEIRKETRQRLAKGDSILDKWWRAQEIKETELKINS